MKLKLLSAFALVGMAVASQQAVAADGTINFTGNISANTCTINGGGAGLTVAVALPTVTTAALNTAGMTAGTTPFQIVLTNCPTTGTAHTFFEPGPTTDMTTGRLKNATGTGFATLVQVGLLNDDLSVIDVSKADGLQGSQGLPLTTGSATLKYRAQYIATGGAATAGTVSTSVAYTIVYN